MKTDTPRHLGYRVKRIGREWAAFLRRPHTPQPLFYVGRNKHEAIAMLLNGVAKMAREAPGRLWPQGN